MELNEFCGEGVFGRVETVPVNYDGRRYVTKKMSLNRLKFNDKTLTLSTILKELRILAKLDHRQHIVRYYFYGFEGPNKDKYEKDENTPIEYGLPNSDGKFSGPEDYFFICMEYCESDLEKLLIQKNSQEERNKFKRKFYSMFEQIMTAMEYFHNENVIHRDIKPPNILLKRIIQDEGKTEDWMVKICDFGLAYEEVQGVDAKSCRGTPLYQAPEMKSRNYSSKVDIFSAGLTFLEMLCYFKDKREKDIIFGSIFCLKDEDEFDRDAKLGLDILDIQLIKAMTMKDVGNRPDAKKVLEMIKRNEIPTESTISNDRIKLEGQTSTESSTVAEDKGDSKRSISPAAKFSALTVNHGIEQHAPLIFFKILEPSKKFSGRMKKLEELREMFNTVCIPQCDPVRNLILISGLSGVGKSELVRQFAKELKNEKLANCVWLQGETHVTLEDSILKLADLLQIKATEPDANKPKAAIVILSEIIESTKKHNHPWVFVIDNLDRKEELGKLAKQVIENLQNPPNIFVIVTSQLPGAVEGEGHHMELDVWSDKEACAFVTKHLENAGKQEDIQKLCETLQNLPLILNLAVNSIEKKRRTGSTKGRSYSLKDYREEILSEKYDKELPEELDRLKNVWQVIHGDILKEELGPVAIDVLGCLSHLNPDGIHIDILTKLILSATNQSKDEADSYWMSRVYNRVFSYISSFRYVEPGAALWPEISSISNLDEHYSSIIPKCLVILRSYSLIRMEDDVVTLHRLVQKVVRLVNPVGPSPLVQPSSYSPLSKLGCGAEVILKEAKLNKDALRQITLIWDHIKKVDALLINFKCMPSNISQWMGQLGLVLENLEFLRAAISTMSLRLLPEDDKALLLLRRDLGVGYQLAEKMEEAQEIFQKLNPLMERVFGESDVNTILSNLSYGAVLRYYKRESEAFKLYEDLLEKAQALAREKQLDDTDLTVKIKQKLAHLYGKKGELQKELHSLQDILKWKEENQDGSDKAKISELRTRQNIGCCYMRSKMYKEAKETFEFVYEKRLELLKEDHPSTLNTKHDLAEAMLYLGEDKETGLRYLQEVLSLKTKVQGESHRRTKLTRDAIDHWSATLESTEAVTN